jgi:lipopolysaccharide transport system ATP-binding protein
MRSRLGFSTAIQINPDVLLIDEVLGVGDEDFRLKSTREIKRLIHSEKTVVLVSHQIPVVKELCDRLAWIECAHIKRLDLTSSVLEEYATHNVVSKTC